MATGRLSSRGKSLRDGLQDDAKAAQQQIDELREEIAALTSLLARDASEGAGKVKSKVRAAGARARDAAEDLKGRAEDDFSDLISAGEDFLSDLQKRYQDSGQRLCETVRERPLATLGLAAAAGFLLASLWRR
ncbi:DUF883 family protein [Shinella daejeonensis]|uniref:hypothetical protein n=1 Tax=Shinella daejeonensis TaxID=659017 RepID=UPI0020C821CB|nr:hypothetical protein [Shinella daejeonensis]MCP8894094.1 DUF883 family protein [Shinella daejeonensis]